MDEASQQILQHPVVGLVASPPLRMDSLGQLRMDSLDTPGSGKMVSLADLHVNSGGPVVTPGTVDSQVRGTCCWEQPRAQQVGPARAR
jgi:hypothetical protein